MSPCPPSSRIENSADSIATLNFPGIADHRLIQREHSCAGMSGRDGELT
jgi:hypothetical protein